MWTASGTGVTTVVSDGTSGVAQFTYSASGSGNWTFSTVSDFAGPIMLSWSYTGHHSFFNVRARLNAFVTTGSGTTTTTLVNAGPANCCTAPSAGFSYSGSTTLTVGVGDTYGFTLSGSNGDSNPALSGTLTVTLPTPAPYVAPPARTSYCSAQGNTRPFDGTPIAPGTFLDLVSGQPETDPHYTGATPAIFVEGVGLTCDPPPAGYVRSGLAGNDQHVGGGVYAYYTRAAA